MAEGQDGLSGGHGSDYGLKCAWEGPAGIDTEMMEEVMETGILQKADAIITQGVVDPDMVREAQAQGIPVVLVDSDIPESDSFAYIGKNFRAAGRDAAGGYRIPLWRG